MNAARITELEAKLATVEAKLEREREGRARDACLAMAVIERLERERDDARASSGAKT